MKSLLFLLLLALAACDAYNIPRARQMMYMSAITKRPVDSIDAWDCPQCARYPAVSHQKGFSTKNNQGLVAYSPTQNAIIVAFRGSSNLNNWLTNLDTIQIRYNGCSGCYVHKGFYVAYRDQLSPVVRPLLEQLLSLYGEAKIIITGHSLGGALAVLCALEVKEIYGRVDEVYTMGQPRVGNAKFAAHLQAQLPSTYRIINNADIVVHVPPTHFAFKHGGHEVWYTQEMQKYVICVSEDPSCANSVPTTKFNTGDHSLEKYEKIKNSNSLFSQIQSYYYSRSANQDKQIILDQQFMQNELNGVSNFIQELKLEEASSKIQQ